MKQKIIAVLTGDVVKSRSVSDSSLWLESLRAYFSTIGEEGPDWFIYRGDSFQIVLDDYKNALSVVIKTRAILKAIDTKLDARIAIGIGAGAIEKRNVNESHGTAYYNSGEQFEFLRPQKTTLLIKTPWESFDSYFNVILKLVSVIIEGWSQKSAEIVKLLWLSDMMHKSAASQLNISPAAVSLRLQAAAFDELMETNKLFENEIAKNA